MRQGWLLGSQGLQPWPRRLGTGTGMGSSYSELVLLLQADKELFSSVLSPPALAPQPLPSPLLLLRLVPEALLELLLLEGGWLRQRLPLHAACLLLQLYPAAAARAAQAGLSSRLLGELMVVPSQQQARWARARVLLGLARAQGGRGVWWLRQRRKPLPAQVRSKEQALVQGLGLSVVLLVVGEDLLCHHGSPVASQAALLLRRRSTPLCGS